MRSPTSVAPLVLSLVSLALACTGRSAGPPGSGSGVSGAVEAGNGTGPANGSAEEPAPPPADPGPPPADPGPPPTDPGPPPADPGTVGPACGDKTCAAGEQCISYYGIAGPSGPKFQECGIPCNPRGANGGCPAGKRCQTIADGPGPVCR
jgi:hypothetical protein